MKAVLVIDMPDIPKNCMSCPLIEYHREYSVICRHYQTGDTRPTWCPLRPLPKKLPPNELGNMSIYKSGWNDCLKEITGDHIGDNTEKIGETE